MIPFDEEKAAQVRMLLAKAVAAKARYWVAMRELEEATHGTAGYDNDALDSEVSAIVSMIAVDLDDPDQAFTMVDLQHVLDLVRIFEQYINP